MITIKLIFRDQYTLVVEVKEEKRIEIMNHFAKNEVFYLKSGVTTILIKPDMLITAEIV